MPERSPGRPERLDSEWKVRSRAKLFDCVVAGGERADRRLVEIDVGVAFVREHCEVVLVGSGEQCSPIVFVGAGAFRIGGRADENGDCPLEQFRWQRRVVGKEIRLLRRRHEHRFGAARQRRRRVALIERVRDQDRWPLAGLRVRRDDERRQEQPLARAVERQQMLCRDRSPSPAGRSAASASRPPPRASRRCR